MLDTEKVVSVSFETVNRNRRSSNMSSRFVICCTISHLLHILSESVDSCREFLERYILAVLVLLSCIIIVVATSIAVRIIILIHESTLVLFLVRLAKSLILICGKALILKLLSKTKTLENLV
ncbi:Uncharacterised protein [Segatella copri]|nr:Uncharacterised protein [Segatella copri]